MWITDILRRVTARLVRKQAEANQEGWICECLDYDYEDGFLSVAEKFEVRI